MTKRTYPTNGHCRANQNGWVAVEDQEPKQDNGMLIYLAIVIVCASIGAYIITLL